MTDIHIQTPLLESLSIGKDLPGRVWLKAEALQPSGSFKLRGVGYACRKYVEQGARAFLSSSGGNAGLAVAYAGRRMEIPVTVIVPESTTRRAIDLIEAEGAEVKVVGKDWLSAHKHALELVDDESAYIHPFDDPLLWTGHASILDEVWAAGVKPDAVVLSVGGGGLLCGVVEGLRRQGCGEVPILAVETRGADSFATAVAAGKYVGIEAITSLATSLGARKVARRAFELASEYPIESLVISDGEAVRGCYRLLEEHRLLSEPACGAAVSALQLGAEFLRDKENIVVILCGGVGVTLGQLAEWRRRVA